MPLFRRPDGELVKGESFVRRMMPYIMRGRNESVIYHETQYEVAAAQRWIKEYNHAAQAVGGQAATLFHLLMWACGRALNERPGLNRFVSGGRIYQRKGVFISFAAKKSIRDGAPLVTVKVEFPKDDAFPAYIQRVVGSIKEGRSDKERRIDKEVKFFVRLPHFLLRFVVAVARVLDRWNLMPRSMLDPDPMYCSLFLANLGSVGVDNTFHHLYEYGTATLFGVMGTVKKAVLPGPNDQPEVREIVNCRWSFDERVNDGLYCMGTLRIVQKIFEDPYQHVGDPAQLAVGAATSVPRGSITASA